MVIIALTTGMRKGEILGLKWDFIKFDSSFVILPVTKNNTVRIIPVNDALIRELKGFPGIWNSFLATGQGSTWARFWHYSDPLKLLVGDAGIEPTAFGSGDQRSIHLS